MSRELQRFFPPFRLDIANAQLWRNDQKIFLRPKTFDVLAYLIDHPGQLVTKAELLDAIWAEVTVSESMPANCVAELRKALGDKATAPRFVETAHRRGYRFLAQVTTDPAEAAVPIPPRLPKSPRPIMVGREDELARLWESYSRARDGGRLMVFIGGEAGIGKTTLAHAFLDSIAQQGTVRVGLGQCIEQYGAGEPYMPVFEALSRLSREPGGDQVTELLNKFAPTWLAQMPGLLTQKERVRLLSEIQGVTQQRMLREMAQALEALSTESPLVLLLEDLQWSDFSTLELISAVARRTEPAQLLVLGTYRPEEMLAEDRPLGKVKHELELHHYCEDLRLKPLSGEDVEDYLAKRLTKSGLRRFDTLAPVIHARADGNPLFMVNMVDYLLRDAGFQVSPRKANEAEWAAALHKHRLDALRSVGQMIERNLERLRPDEQEVLEGASVAGAEFSAAAVAAALGRPQDEVEAHCIRLSRREQFVSGKGPVIWPDGTVASGFRFRHALYQEVLYARLPVNNQVQLHRRLAQRLEVGYGERASEVATELAHHYARANNRPKALQYFQLAGERASMRGATVEVEGHYLEALTLLDAMPQRADRDHRELELLLALGPALIALRGYASPEVERTYSRARVLCERGSDPNEFFCALYGQWLVHLNRGEFGAARDLAEQLLRRAQSIHDSTLLLYAHYALGNTLFWMGEFALANIHLKKATALYDPERHGQLPFRYFPVSAQVMCLAYTAWTFWHLGYPDQARDTVEEALTLSQRLPHRFSRGLAEMSATVLHLLRRETREVQAGAERVITLSAGNRLSDFLSWATAMCGWATAKLGRYEEGVALMQEAFAALRTTGSELLRPHLLCLLAEAHKNAGHVDDELSALTEAQISTNQHEIRHYEAEMYRLKGESLLRQDERNVAQAQKCFERAIEIARRQSAKSWELRATTSLARLLDKQGHDARGMLTEIYEWFTEGFETADLKDAKTLLDELNDWTPQTVAN